MAESRSTKTRAPGTPTKRQRGGRRGHIKVYSRKIEDQICARLAAGEGLATICKDPNMPVESVVRMWVMDDKPPGIAARYARARQLGYHKMADEIIELSDDTSYLDRTTASAIVQQRRLAVDSRRWLLSKVLPKVYGDRIEVSGDPEAPLVTRIELVPVAPIAIEARPVIEHEPASKPDANMDRSDD